MPFEYDLSKITDLATRDALQGVRDLFRELPFLRGDWIFKEITFATVGYNTKYPHNLRFQPKDLIQTYISEDSALVWNYTLFNTTHLDVDVIVPCTVRIFVGRFTP